MSNLMVGCNCCGRLSTSESHEQSAETEAQTRKAQTNLNNSKFKALSNNNKHYILIYLHMTFRLLHAVVQFLGHYFSLRSMEQ